MADYEIEPCPFCGTSGESHLLLEQHKSGGWRIWCFGCAALGPHSENKEDALKLWNSRKKQEATYG